MRRKRLIKRVLTGVLAFLLIFSFILTSLSTVVHASSNTRAGRYIALGAEKSTVSSLGNNEFSYDEMRIIGIFLSNFYVPWSTQINNSDDNDANEATKENMIQALTDTLNFDEGVAEELVATVFSMSQSSAKPLYIRTNSSKVEKTEAKCSWANFIIPQLSKRSDNFFEHGDARTVKKEDEFWCYWIDENTSTEHTVWYTKNGVGSPCSIALTLVMSQLNMKNGYGSGFLGTSSDFEASGKMTDEAVEDWLSNFANYDEALTSTALGQQMYIDCFGNIICDNGQGRAFIVIPACLNPYTFIKDGEEAGKALPVNNLYCMALNSRGELLETATDEDTTKSLDKLNINNCSYRNVPDLFTYGRGSSGCNWDTKKGKFGEGEGGKLIDGILEAYSSSSEYNFINESYLTDGNGGEELSFLEGDAWQYGGKITVIQDWMLFNSIGEFSSNNESIKANEFGIFGKDWGTLQNPVSQQFSTGVDKDNAFNIMIDENSKCYAAGIFTSYVFAYFRSDGVSNEGGVSGSSSEEASTEASSETTDTNASSESSVSDSDKVKYKINLDNLPVGGDGKFTVSVSGSEIDGMLKSFMLYFLHPEKGVEYIKQLFGKLTSSFLLKVHEDIVGNTSTNNTTGGSRYLGFSGYVTVPNLHDLAWTQWLLDNYDTFFVYFVVFMALVLICYVFIGSLTFQKGMIGLVVFSICAYLPPTLINTTVDYSNKICDSIYGSKFTYWALVQHESYVYEINYALSQADNSSYNDFLLAQFKSQSEYTSGRSTSVALKWLAPKKDNYLVNFEREIDEASGGNGTNLIKVISGILSERVSGESYLEGNNDMFLYRSYTDISTYSSASYNWLKREGTSSIDLESSLTNIKTDSNVSLGDKVTSGKYLGKQDAEYSLQYATNLGFNYPTQDSSYNSKYCQRVLAPLCSKTVSKAIKRALSNVSLASTEEVGITQDNFQITVSNLNSNDANVKINNYGTFTFGEYTESPFYYFSFNLYDQARYGENANLFNNADGNTYKNLFLQGDGDYFYNNDSSIEGSAGFGELRDYTDMRSLFYCVIPYLKEANDVVRKWDDEYGLWLYDGIDITYSEGVLDNISESKDSELYYKWWHNVTVSQLFNMYSPWVDKMYDCSYAKPEKIVVHGEKFTVNDPLDPYSYYTTDSTGKLKEGRYMVFSESEMQYYGLTYSDLTEVEQKIINIQKNSYKDLLSLMNYYTFDYEVLNTASAMIETFNFNKEFSQSSLFGEDYMLFPQNYELKNFTYDAYLRLILVNATGELLQGTDSIGNSVNLYKTILDNTSFLTGVLMIGLDAIATYVIPALKLFFLLAVFALSVFVIVSAVLNIQLKISNVIVDSLVKPLVQFFLVSIGMAFVISLFMSDGNTAVTGGSKFSISLGDPTMTIIAMLAINIVVVVLYWKICKKTFENCKKYAEAVLTSIAGTTTGALAKITGAAMVSTAIAKALPSNIVNSRDRRLQNKANREIIKNDGNSGAGGDGITKKQRKAVDKANKADGDLEKARNKKDSYNSRIERGKERTLSEFAKIDDSRSKLLDKQKTSGLSSKEEKKLKSLDKKASKKDKHLQDLERKQSRNNTRHDKSISKKEKKAREKNAYAGRNKSTRKK